MQESILMAAMDTFNERASAATGIGAGEHAVASAQQWTLTSTGTDIDQGELMAYAESLADMMGETARAMPEDVPLTAVLVDGLRQMFLLGALHEQERARRDAATA